MASTFPATYIPSFHHKAAVQKMIYNKFGETGLQVSKLGFGGSTVGFCKSLDEEEEGIKTIINAVKNGINYIDTAPYYGEGKAETVLGKALKQIPRNAYYIGTKVGRYEANIPKMFDFSAARTIKSFEESLERLGLTYVDVIQVHDVEFAPNVDIIVNETLPALQSIRDSGRARFIGITGYPISKLKEVLEKTSVKIDLVLSYCRCTLFDDTLREYLPYFKSKGLGIINAAILGMNLLTNNPVPLWHPVKPHLKEVCAKAANYCKAKNINIARLALYHSLNQEDIATHLVGMAGQNAMQENLDVLFNGLTEAELDTLNEIQKKFFLHCQEKHWENCEVTKYWEVMKQRN